MEKQRKLLQPIDISKVHWKVQATVHFTLSIPLALLTVFSWGIQLPALGRVLISYLALYFFVFLPIYGLLPILQLKKVQKEITKINNGEKLTDDELSHIVTYLLNYPLPAALISACLEMSAFIIGAIVWKSGLIVPELLPIIGIALLETLILGIITAINVSFLNLVHLENFTGRIVEKIVNLYPRVLELKLNIRRFSMYRKVLFLILLTTIAGEISILLFFVTYLLSTNSQELLHNGRFILSIIIINVIYVFILAPIVAKNFTEPMSKLVYWIKEVTHGNMESRINFITNDETEDIIKGSNIMIDTVDKITTDLANSLQILKTRSSLLESEKNKLSTVLVGVIDGVIALNGYKQVTLMNKAAEDITGWMEKDAIKRDIKEVLKVYNENNELLINKDFFQSFEIHSSTTYKNEKLITADGKEKYINLTCSATGEIQGTDTAYIITFHDITEERALENMKLDFVSMAAHELRTPTTIMKAYLETYLQQYGKELNTDQNVMITRTLYTARQLSSLINILLTVSKVERKVVDLEIIPVPWKPFIEHTILDLSYMAKEKNIDITSQFSEDFTATVEADQNRITEVLGNLISNAVNYSAADGKIIVSVNESSDEVTTHIKDFGMGIPEEAISHLFKKFYRVSTPLRDESKGTGLGLYMAKAIVEMHGGKIWVNSKVNEGSIFSFSLPKKHVQKTE